MFGRKRREALEAELFLAQENLRVATNELRKNGWRPSSDPGFQPARLSFHYSYDEHVDSTVTHLKRTAAAEGRKEGYIEMARALGYGEYPGGPGALLADIAKVRGVREVAAEEAAADQRLRKWGIRVEV